MLFSYYNLLLFAIEEGKEFIGITFYLIHHPNPLRVTKINEDSSVFIFSISKFIKVCL